VCKEVAKQMTECFLKDEERVAIELQMSLLQASEMIEKAKAGEPAAVKRLAPFEIGVLEAFNGGQPMGFDDHPSQRLPRLKAELEVMQNLIRMHDGKLIPEDEILDPVELEFLRYKTERFGLFLEGEGYRHTEDSTPWMPELYDQYMIDSTKEKNRGKFIQRAIWATLCVPPTNEKGEACLLHVMATIKMLFAKISPDSPFVNPSNLESESAMMYAANFAQEAGLRQVAALQKNLPEESVAAGWEAGMMSTVLNAVFDSNGIFFSDSHADKARGLKKRLSMKHRGKLNEDIPQLPRGYVPGYEALHAAFVLVGSK